MTTTPMPPEERRKFLADAELHRRVRRALYRRGLRGEQIKDALQDVLAAAWKAPRFPTDPVEALKYTVAMAGNIAVDAIAEQTDDVHFDDEAPHAVTLEECGEAERDLAGRVFDAAVERDPQAAEWVVRTKIQGEKVENVASEVGMQPAAMRQRIKRLLDWLRENTSFVSLVVGVLMCIVAGLPEMLAGVANEPGPETPPTVTPAPRKVPPRAQDARDRAFAECDQGNWEDCLVDLDEAKEMDPAGEADPRVREARAKATDALGRQYRGPAPAGTGKPGSRTK